MSLSHCDRISERVKGYQMELAGVLMSNGLIEHAGNIARAALIRPSFEDLDAEKVWHGMVWSNMALKIVHYSTTEQRTFFIHPALFYR